MIDSCSHAIRENCFTNKGLEEHLNYASGALKSVLFGDPKFVMGNKMSSNRRFSLLQYQELQSTFKIQSSHLREFYAHFKIGSEEYASTISELNTFISTLCTELGKVSFGGTAFKSLREMKNVFALDLIGFLKKYGINNSFMNLCSKLHSTVAGKYTNIASRLIEQIHQPGSHEYNALKNNFISISMNTLNFFIHEQMKTESGLNCDKRAMKLFDQHFYVEIVKHYFLQDRSFREKCIGIDRKKTFELEVAVSLQTALLFDLFRSDDCDCIAGALDGATRQRNKVESFSRFCFNSSWDCFKNTLAILVHVNYTRRKMGESHCQLTLEALVVIVLKLCPILRILG